MTGPMKLTDDDRKEIVRRYRETAKPLALEFHVSQALIYSVLKRAGLTRKVCVITLPIVNLAP
jgi:hypothetical protein